MFKNLPFGVKIVLLLLLYTAVFIIEYWLFSFTLNQEDPSVLSAAVLTFLQCWNLMLVGFLFFQTFKYVRFPKIFYQVLPFETPAYFKWIGVDLFRHVLVNSFFRRLNNRVYLKNRGEDYFRIFHEETKQSETSHWFSLLATLIPQLIYLVEGMSAHFIWLTVWSVIFNVYPMLLQRKNRFKMESKYPRLFGKDNSESSS